MRLRLAMLAASTLLAACGAPEREAASPERMSWPDLTERDRPTDVIHDTHEVWSSVRDGAPLGTLWVPPGPGPHPVVLMIHGGCWQKEIADRTLMDWAAADLWARGIAVWNIEYRGVDEPGGGYPGTFADVAEAAGFLADRDALAEFALDTDRVVALGHSAGGHLALWFAASGQLPEDHPAKSAASVPLLGVVSTGGLPDLAESEPVTLPSCLADVRAQLTGPPSDARPDPYADTSPDRMLPLGVPQVSIAGADDPISPPGLAMAWTAEARAAGDAAKTVIVSGGHVELIAPGTPAWAETVRQIEALLGEG